MMYDSTLFTSGNEHHVRAVTLIRHGRTAYNAASRLQGQVDIPLDEVGRWQIQQTARELRSLYVDNSPEVTEHIVISSDLGRALETAHAFADSLGVEITPDSRVRERNFGDWEGMSRAQLIEQWPQDYSDWINLKDGELKHGAEPKTVVGSRGAEAVNEWARKGNSNSELFVFSHGAWINQTVQTLLGLDKVNPNFVSLVSMRNAFWARLIPKENSQGTLDWRLVDYAHGPQAAYATDWDNPVLS